MTWTIAFNCLDMFYSLQEISFHLNKSDKHIFTFIMSSITCTVPGTTQHSSCSYQLHNIWCHVMSQRHVTSWHQHMTSWSHSRVYIICIVCPPSSGCPCQCSWPKTWHHIMSYDMTNWIYHRATHLKLSVICFLEVGRLKVLEPERIYQNCTGCNRLSLCIAWADGPMVSVRLDQYSGSLYEL